MFSSRSLWRHFFPSMPTSAVHFSLLFVACVRVLLSPSLTVPSLAILAILSRVLSLSLSLFQLLSRSWCPSAYLALHLSLSHSPYSLFTTLVFSLLLLAQGAVAERDVRQLVAARSFRSGGLSHHGGVHLPGRPQLLLLDCRCCSCSGQ